MEFVDQLIRIISVVGSIAGPIFAAGWWLINKYSADQKRIKELEVTNVLSSVTALDEQIREHRKTIYSLTESMASWRIEVVKVQTLMHANTERDADNSRRVEDMIKVYNGRFSNIEATLQDGEIVHLGEKRFMFKGKKNP